MTVLYDLNPNPRGKWGWWGDPNVTDEMIVDYEMQNKGLNLPGGFGIGLGADPFGGKLAGRYGLFAQASNKLTPVQAAAQSFGDIPILGDLIKTIRDYEDRINYRNADPETRKLLGLE